MGACRRVAQASIPISIVYETQGSTPIRDVIAALEATELLVQDAVALLPSLLPGLHVELRSVNVQRISQESPLKEIVLAVVWVTSQKDLEAGVTALAADLLGVDVPQQYQSIVTLVVLVVLFYGVALAKDIVSRMVSDGAVKRKFDALIEDLAQSTGKTTDSIRKILDAKYAKPGPVKSLVRASVNFFLPSMREGNRSIILDRDRIEPEIVGEIPYSQDVSEDKDFKKFDPMEAVQLSLHAQDIDKSATGWAAIPEGLTDRRLRLKLIPPVEPEQLWGKSKVTDDIVLISKLTAQGYQPDEIHLTSVQAAE